MGDTGDTGAWLKLAFVLKHVIIRIAGSYTTDERPEKHILVKHVRGLKLFNTTLDAAGDR